MVIKIRMKVRKDAKERSQRVKKGRKMEKLEGRKQSMEGRKEGSRVRKEGRQVGEKEQTNDVRKERRK